MFSFKERFPNLFKDSTVYLDVCEMLAVYHYSLPARRLAHSLFEGITLDPVRLHDYIQLLTC